jgi:hypothetical protein
MVPNLFQAIYTVLIACASPLALFCFITAGFQLRNEGGVNYSSNGSFFKWILWGAIFLTIIPIFAWLNSEGFVAAGTSIGSYSPSYTAPIQHAVTDFVTNFLLAKIVPVIAGALVLKSLLDAGEGHSPFPSIISALFLLGVDGFYVQAQGWNDGSVYATASVLKGMLNWALNSVAPVLGAMSIYGAILQFVRRQNWVTYVFVGAALLVAPALWSLVQSWAGVSIS